MAAYALTGKSKMMNAGFAAAIFLSKIFPILCAGKPRPS